MNIEFKVQNIQCYIEDDVCVVAFADSMSPDPDQYLILTQTLFDSPERNRGDKNIGIDCNHFSIAANVTSISLNDWGMEMELVESEFLLSSIKIIFDNPPSDLREYLKKYFSDLQK